MCSYCGCDQLDVIGRFMAEHGEIVNAAGALRAAARAGDRAAAQRAADAVAGLLHPHTHAEEVGLFAVMREQAEFTDTVDRLCGEHEELDRMLHAVRGGDLGGVDAFVDALRHHIDREDNGLFPASAVGLSGADWDRVLEQTPPAVQAGATAGR